MFILHGFIEVYVTLNPIRNRPQFIKSAFENYKLALGRKVELSLVARSSIKCRILASLF